MTATSGRCAVKKLLTSVKTGDYGVHKRSMEESIVDTMSRYFRDEKGKMGNLELSIVNSVKRYFEAQPPKRTA